MDFLYKSRLFSNPAAEPSTWTSFSRPTRTTRVASGARILRHEKITTAPLPPQLVVAPASASLGSLRHNSWRCRVTCALQNRNSMLFWIVILKPLFVSFVRLWRKPDFKWFYRCLFFSLFFFFLSMTRYCELWSETVVQRATRRSSVNWRRLTCESVSNATRFALLRSRWFHGSNWQILSVFCTRENFHVFVWYTVLSRPPVLLFVARSYCSSCCCCESYLLTTNCTL